MGPLIRQIFYNATENAVLMSFSFTYLQVTGEFTKSVIKTSFFNETVLFHVQQGIGLNSQYCYFLFGIYESSYIHKLTLLLPIVEFLRQPLWGQVNFPSKFPRRVCNQCDSKPAVTNILMRFFHSVRYCQTLLFNFPIIFLDIYGSKQLRSCRFKQHKQFLMGVSYYNVRVISRYIETP